MFLDLIKEKAKEERIEQIKERLFMDLLDDKHDSCDLYVECADKISQIILESPREFSEKEYAVAFKQLVDVLKETADLDNSANDEYIEEEFL